MSCRAAALPILLALAAGLASPIAARAQRELTNIPDPDPEVERKSFQVADGFEVNLYAADPLLAKPIQMNFDPQGRLWVASSEVYPQIAPGQEADDKILVLQDDDGDGAADRTTVFARGLLIPTGVEPGDGGAYVANSTELVHLADTDGDLEADRRRVVLSGFGTEDTHHIIHTFRWGHDGGLYFNQSIYIHSNVETPWGVRRLGGGGIWRLKPRSLELEVTLRGLVNPWGHHADRWGQHFATDGAGGEGINYAIPGAYYFTAVGAERLLEGLNPGSPKHCGLEVASGRHLPDDWQGDLLTNDFRANRVCRFKLADDGAGFVSREQPEILKTTHSAFRPIDVKMGPDGAIYVADWYNPIIQHGEVDFRDPRRDHTRGRIWRVTAQGRPLVERPKLVGASVAELLEHLKAPEGWTRRQAQRVLIERGAAAVLPELSAWTAGLDKADPEFEHHRLEALWTFQALDTPEPSLMAAVIASPDPRARAAAARVAGDWRDRIDDPIGRLAPLAVDDHPRVRLEAARALAKVGTPAAVAAAMRALEKPIDGFLDYGLWLTARETREGWLPEVAAGRLDFGGDGRALAFALTSANTPAAVAPLMAAIRAGKIPAESEPAALEVVGRLGGPGELSSVLDAALATDAPAGRRAGLLRALAGAAARGARPEGGPSRLATAMADASPEVRAAAAELAGRWADPAILPALRTLAADAEATADARRAAAIALARLADGSGRSALVELAADGRPAALRADAAIGLAQVDPAAGAAAAVAAMATGEGVDTAAIVGAFLGQQGGPEALAAALDGKALPADVAKVAQRQARATGRDQSALIAALARSGGLTGEPPAPTAEQVAALVADVMTTGDPARGEALFRRPDLNCFGCHAIAGAGGRVGPGLESIGASAPADYLVESILAPNKAIKEGYHSTVIVTTDGRVVAGVKVREDDAGIVVRDADDREQAIPATAVEEQAQGGSLMPVGLADSLTRAELVDLVRFLSALGKAGDGYAVGTAQVVRRWEVLRPTEEGLFALRRSRFDTAATPDPRLSWAPAYSAVVGSLPVADLPPMKPRNEDPRVGFARFELEVTGAGSARIALGNPDGIVGLWLDGSPVAPLAEVPLNLESGRRVVTLAIDLDRRRDPLRVELSEGDADGARARIVGGK